MLTNVDQLLYPGAPWPPEDKDIVNQLKIYDDNRLLFEGEHVTVFSEAWERLIRYEFNTSFELCLNWFRRLSTLWGDLLLGEQPSIAMKSDEEANYLDDLIRRTRFWDVAYKVAIDLSRYGGGLFKQRFINGKAQAKAISPAFWFPIVAEDDAQEITAHVLAWVAPHKIPLHGINTTGDLFVEIHGDGYMESRTYGFCNSAVGDLKYSDYQNTGIDGPLVQYVPNLQRSDSLFGMDDYSDITSIIQEIEVRFAQNARVLDRHADPKMHGPVMALEVDPITGEQIPQVAIGDYIPVHDGDNAPGYLTWDGHISDAMEQVKMLMEQFYMLTETSPAIFGDNRAGLAESGSALKRLLMAPIAKARRIRNTFNNACLDALKKLAALEGRSLDDIHIEWGDGIPDDWGEDSRIINERVSAGTISLKRAISIVDDLEGENLEQELKDINDAKPQDVEPPKIRLE
ncbi:phage portal protein [Aminobacterium colombiense]